MNGGVKIDSIGMKKLKTIRKRYDQLLFSITIISTITVQQKNQLQLQQQIKINYN
jgi:hypothetical protein